MQSCESRGSPDDDLVLDLKRRAGEHGISVEEEALILERWLAGLKHSFNERVLEVTVDVADCWGSLQAIRSLPAVDALIAATTLHHDLTLVTRNVVDFDGLGLTIVNPFEPGT